MFQGTGSDVGKSTLVAGLCRIAKQRGINVAPFKPQNMSNNAAACPGGGEIGRAQALQARAAGLPLQVDFNPVLIKPQSDMSAQIVVHGQVLDTVTARDYMTRQRGVLMQPVLDSFHRLASQYDLILIEGAGSPAEVNLRERDIANMGFACEVNAPVCLIGDIDRGGVIAAVAGTKSVLSDEDASLISSFVINRFRGDPTLFEDGVTAIEKHTGWPCRGVVPWLPAATRLPQEDAVVLQTDNSQRSVDTHHTRYANHARINIAVPMLSRIANFDDVDPLRMEKDINLYFVPPGTPIPLDSHAVIIPGTKSTIEDMNFIRRQGWHHDIVALARNGARILGLCGGYQLLGKYIDDPAGHDGSSGRCEGLGLLDIETRMDGVKTTHPAQGTCARSGSAVSGYEIHNGQTTGADTSRPMTILNGQADGATSERGNIEGTYLHGIFSSDSFRQWWMQQVNSETSSSLNFEATIEQELDELADGLKASLDIDALFADAAYPVSARKG
jgi:adenosylcobyric acid synthase